GLPEAVGMITKAKTVCPTQALRMGLVEGMVTSIPSSVRTLERVQKETLVQAAIAQARVLCSVPVRRTPLRASLRFLSGPGIRTLVCRYARHQVINRHRHFLP